MFRAGFTCLQSLSAAFAAAAFAATDVIPSQTSIDSEAERWGRIHVSFVFQLVVSFFSAEVDSVVVQLMDWMS